MITVGRLCLTWPCRPTKGRNGHATARFRLRLEAQRSKRFPTRKSESRRSPPLPSLILAHLRSVRVQSPFLPESPEQVVFPRQKRSSLQGASVQSFLLTFFLISHSTTSFRVAFSRIRWEEGFKLTLLLTKPDAVCALKTKWFDASGAGEVDTFVFYR